jgi:O-antigen ligase/polysaccharide polymerase Wzy-like membrane protein
MNIEGYPQFVLILVLGGGFFLAFVRPYGAFLFGLLVITAGDTAKFNHTRLPGLGPYLNLADACVLVALAGFFFDRIANKRPIRTPQIVPLILFVLVLAASQSFWKFGWTYETIRALRWCLQLPIFIFLGANMVDSGDRARKLVVALLIGALLAAGQHVLTVANIWWTKSLTMENYKVMRTIAYWGGGMAAAFLLTAVVWKSPASLGKRVCCLMVGVLFLGTLFLNQTRSIWLAATGSVFCMPVLFKSGYPVRRIARFAVLVVVIAVVSAGAFQRVMPGLNLLEMVTGRATQLVSDDPQFKAHTSTRKNAFDFEMDAWWKGTLVFGRGLWYVQKMKQSEDPKRRIAFGHLGYVTYLSQLGMIGFLVYAVYLPFGVIRDSRYLWFHDRRPAVRYVALLGGASIVFISLMFLMSSQFLSPGFEGPGVLYGAMWALARDDSGVIAHDGMSLAAQGGQS